MRLSLRHLQYAFKRERRRIIHARQHSTYLKRCQEIVNETEISIDHMTPEIKLHLITQNCRLWHTHGEQSPFSDPFWAFFWPGGQVLTRYILDNGHIFKDNVVLDVGCGCGASAIACKMVGASRVVANDIDTVALKAARLNASLNNVSVEYSSINLIGQYDNTWDIMLLGDMFYDSAITQEVHPWVHNVCCNGTKVYIGDPGRHSLHENPMKNCLSLIAEYDLPENCLKENHGMASGYVWKFVLN